MGEVYILEDLLNTLINLEIKSFNFYENYKNTSEDPKLKEIFGELAKAEKNHEIFYKSVKDKFINTETIEIDEEYKIYISTLISNNFFMANFNFSVTTVKEALDIAERLEKDTILFMNELSGLITEKASLKVILAEEKKHLLRIYQYKEEHNIA